MIIRLSVCTVRNFMVNTYVHKYVCMYFKIKLYVFILGVNSNYAVNGRSRISNLQQWCQIWLLFFMLPFTVATAAGGAAVVVDSCLHGAGVGWTAAAGLPALSFALTFSNSASKESSWAGAACAALGYTYDCKLLMPALSAEWKI